MTDADKIMHPQHFGIDPIDIRSDVILPVKYNFGFLPVFLPTSCKLFFVYKQCFSALVVWQLANYL